MPPSDTSPRPSPIPHLLCQLIALGAVLFAGPQLAAQVWVPLTPGAAPGTEAQLVFDRIASDENQSFFDLRIHGYWTKDVIGGDALTYQRIRVPGLGVIAQPGAPDLPAVRPRLAIATGAASAQLVSISPIDVRVVPNLLVWPYATPELDEAIDPTNDPGPGDPDGTPEQFTKDAAIYASATPWPPAPPTVVPTTTTLGTIPTAALELLPANWNPATGVMLIGAHLRYHYTHTGGGPAFPLMTKDRFTLATKVFLNWDETTGSFQANDVNYVGRYLVITPAEYLVALEPFLIHKQSMGFSLTVLTTAQTTGICGNIRGAIDGWYQAGSAWADHYCLLVGDTDEIPLCPSPTIDSKLGDDLYGSPGDGDLDEEVWVGRLSVDDAADVTNQVAKIIDYELSPNMAGHYERALLVAHEEDSPEKYEGAQEEVANASYAVPPTFLKRYGSSFTSSNANVQDDIEAGLGLVAYRGHGTTSTWSDWNLLGQDFHKNQVLELSNPFDLPVVWAFNCTNANLDFDDGTSADSIGETWMEHTLGGAVAHYGSTTVSGTVPNHELDKRMFEALYDKGLNIHGHTIAWAEQQTQDAVPSLNPWMYLLLGDPSMRVRRGAPSPLQILGPTEVEVCVGPNCTLAYQVVDGNNQPLEGILVSIWKEGTAPGSPPEVFGSLYTDQTGTATFPSGPSSLGIYNVLARDDEGNVTGEIVSVSDGPWADLGFSLAGTQGTPDLVGAGTLQPNTPMSIDLDEAAPNAITLLFVSAQNLPVPFKCGTLQAHPWLATFNLVTNGGGAIPIQGEWPAGVPADSQFWFQYAIQDPVAKANVALSNALRATTP